MRYKDVLIVLSTLLDCFVLVMVGLVVVGSSRLEKLSPYGGDQLEYIPVYPGAQEVAIDTKHVVTSRLGDTAIRTITFETSNNPRNVQDFYKSKLSKEGWVQTQFRDYPIIDNPNISVVRPLVFQKLKPDPSSSVAPWASWRTVSLTTKQAKNGLIHVEIAQRADLTYIK